MQKFVTAGGLQKDLTDKALVVTNESEAQTDPRLSCNAEESDVRIWLHVLCSSGKRKLVLSPDTDVYHVGLPIIAQTYLEVMIQLSPFSSLEYRILNLQALIKAFHNDPDLASLEKRHNLLQW